MPTYGYKCLECEKRFQWANVPIEKRDEFTPQCPQCSKNNVKRIILAGITFSFVEGNGTESSKPASYWENAERNRLASLEKRRKEQEEKLRDDPNERAKAALRAQREAADDGD